MEPATYDLDADGDKVVILRGSASLFKMMGKEDVTGSHQTNEEGVSAPKESEANPGSVNQDRHSKDIEQTALGNKDQNEVAQKTKYNDVRVRVSSKHLINASRTLKVLMPEGSEWNLADDDSTALLILLCLIHGKNRKVPATPDLPVLTEIAILVDKYDLQELVLFSSNEWRRNIKYPDFSNKSKLEVLSWMLVSWVFDWREIWDKATTKAKFLNDRLISEERLPIPKKALEAIERDRQTIINRIHNGVQNILSEYASQKHCSFECSALQLGALRIKLQEMGILVPPKPPFQGISPDELMKHLLTLGKHAPPCYSTLLTYPRKLACAFTFGVKITTGMAQIEKSVKPVALVWEDLSLKPGTVTKVLKVQETS